MTRADRQRIAEQMYLDGYAYTDMAAHLGVHIETARQYTLPMRRRWCQGRMADV